MEYFQNQFNKEHLEKHQTFEYSIKWVMLKLNF